MQRSRDTDRTENPGRDVLQIFHHEPRRGFLRGLAGVGAGLTVLQTTGIAEAARNKRVRGSAYVGELVAPRIENLRCAFIGVGSRGAGQLERFLDAQGVTVPAIVDPHVPAAEKAAAACEMVTNSFGMSPPMSTHNASQRGHFYLGVTPRATRDKCYVNYTFAGVCPAPLFHQLPRPDQV